MKEMQKDQYRGNFEKLSEIAASWFYAEVVLKSSGKYICCQNHINVYNTSWIFNILLLL